MSLDPSEVLEIALRCCVILGKALDLTKNLEENLRPNEYLKKP